MINDGRGSIGHTPTLRVTVRYCYANANMRPLADRGTALRLWTGVTPHSHRLADEMIWAGWGGGIRDPALPPRFWPPRFRSATLFLLLRGHVPADGAGDHAGLVGGEEAAGAPVDHDVVADGLCPLATPAAGAFLHESHAQHSLAVRHRADRPQVGRGILGRFVQQHAAALGPGGGLAAGERGGGLRVRVGDHGLGGQMVPRADVLTKRVGL